MRPRAYSPLAAVVVLAVAAGAQTTPAPAADPAATVPAALALLEQKGLKPDAGLLAGALLEAVVRAADPGGRVWTAAEHKAFELGRQGLQRGIGAEFAVSNGQTRVASVAAGSPAAEAGLLAGDTLDSVNRRFVTGNPLDRQLEWIGGGTNETVELVVVRGGEKTPRTLKMPVRYLRRPTLRATEELPRNLALMDVNGLWDAAGGAQIADQWRRWEKSGRVGIILDLRHADGCAAPAAAVVAGLLAEPGAELFGFSPQDGRAAETFRAPTNGTPVRLPVMVLVGPETTGAAEALAAALKGGGRGALLLGTATRGDPLVREALPAADGRILYVATRRLRVPGQEEAAFGAGVEPHIAVANGRAPSADPKSEADATDLNPRRKALDSEKDDQALRARVRNDAVLQRATDLLLGLQALKPALRAKTKNTAR